jgi:outer membrane receptor protein involved in Fe transport
MLPLAAPPPDQPEVVQTVTVRAARLAPAQAEKVFSVIQVNRVALQTQPRLDEALEEVPGLSLFRRSSSLSANPTVEGISLREIGPTGAGRALVTLDGVPQGDPFGGWVIWSGLPSDSIQSVDVVRGAGAGPYGAGALTGTIAMKERVLQPGDWAADGEAGGIGFERGSAIGDVAVGPGDLFVSASGEHSNGWIPIIAGRGAADTPLELDDRQFAARYNADLGPGVLSARVSEYSQDQGTGVANGFARTEGVAESLSWATQPTASTMGAQLQVWARQTGFSQLSLSEAAGHATATPADLQYATPADGLGVNGAIRRATSHYSWELGFDARGAEGETHELFGYAAGAFNDRRLAGGRDLVAGVYAEGSADYGPWTFTGGARVDEWRDWNGHLLNTVLSTGAATTNNQYAAKGGAVPTARVGVKRDLGDGFYARAAAYAGFRAPSLNELYRPYRVGNQSISANAALQPEKLYGGEAGVGRDFGFGSIDADVFANRMDDPIINVTTGPTTLERENVPEINAIGTEVQAQEHLFGDRLSLHEALSATDARVDGGSVEPQLTGKRPAQAPIWTTTAGADWKIIDRLTLSAVVRYESGRFDDDLNQNPLGTALTENARLTWTINRHADLFLNGENLSDARVATAVNTDGTVDYGEPRIISVGVSFRR